MGIQIGAKMDSGFDNPIGMLKDCHRRIEHFLGVLCAVVERAQSRGLTEEEIAAVHAAINYFRTGGQCLWPGEHGPCRFRNRPSQFRSKDKTPRGTFIDDGIRH